MRENVGGFKYFVGIKSLDQIATRDDRVCVLNILGGESSDVTPVGHAWSGGNVVCGTSPGRRGQVLETEAGPIPVYNNVREAIEAGHQFNCGVVYLPPDLGARFDGDMDDLKAEAYLYGSQGATTLDLVPLLAFKMLGLTVDPVFGVVPCAGGPALQIPG